MRYSINSRFHGTLLGATLAEKITHQGQIIPNPIAKIIVPGVQSLVEWGRFEQQSWLDRLLILKLTPLQAIAVTLPLALFYHDNKINLRSTLLSVASLWQHELAIQESILAMGYAIAQALTEKLCSQKLIPQILEFIDAPNSQLTNQLIQVQTLLQQKTGLEQTINQLTANGTKVTRATALGFYYFLSTVEDCKLSIQRSRRSPNSGFIVGALSGAYNSASSIPSSWQTLLIEAKTSTEPEMLKLSNSLVAVWSGVYDSEAKLTATAVAAPRVIRLH